MMKNRKEFATKFAQVLIQHLIKKYNKVPSGYFFANQFNLRAQGTSTITAETARKWIKGISVPEIDRFKVLIDWLDFNPAELFDTTITRLSNKEVDEVIDAFESKIYELQILLSKFKKKKN